MKIRNYLVAFFCLFVFHHGFGQNWAAFNSGRSYHYRSDTAAFPDQTVHFDTVVAVGLDSNLAVARRFRAGVDTSQRNIAMFCGREVSAFGDGLFNFKNPINAALPTRAGIGTTFTLDSLTGMTATVSRVYEGVVFGSNIDSIKVFTTPMLDSLVLSKSFGILEWPASLGQGRFTLSGIQEDAVGDTMPGFDGFFKFKAGDVYYYESNHYLQDFLLQRDYFQVKMEIDSAIRSATGLHVYWSGLVRHSMFINNTLVNVSPTTTSGDFMFLDTKNGLVKKSHQEQLRAPLALKDYNMNANFARYGYTPAVDSNNTFWAGMWSYTTFQPATDGMEFRIGNMSGNTSWLYVSAGGENCVISGSEFRTVIKEGKGIIQVIWSEFESYGDFNLVGSIIDGDTSGVIFTDEVLLGMNAPIEIAGLHLSPNPSTGPLQIEWSTPAVTTIELMDIHGKVCLRSEVSGVQASLDVQDLPSGVYLLKAIQNGQFAVKRVVVLE